MGRHGEALASCDTALGINDAMYRAHLLKGELLAETGRSEEALASCDRAVSLARYDKDAHLQQGNLLAETGRSEEGLRRTIGQSHWT